MRLIAIHEVVQLQPLEESRLLQLLARLHVVVLEEVPVGADQVHALVEAGLGFLRPLRCLCARGVTSARKGCESNGQNRTSIRLLLTLLVANRVKEIH